MSSRSPTVSAALERSLFVIPSINGGALLRRMLPTLRLPPHTVVVLDQGSTDDTEAVCRAAGVGLVQLGRPHTYTEAGNIGARMARDAGCDFVFLSNNDIAFTTDVGAELLAEMLDDPLLGIVAPSQVIVDEKAGQSHLAYRVGWHLDTMRFMHDFQAPSADVGRLEADMCELTCAAVRMSAIAELGFLDDDFGFYHEDADFCFRLRRAGYSCAYLPRSQIEHYTSSTFSAGLSDRKRAYMLRNAELFARKHLGYGVRRLVVDSRAEDAAGGAGRHLSGYLDRFGLVDLTRPALVLGGPVGKPFDYLHLDALDSASRVPFGRLRAYRGLVAGSEGVRQALQDAGFEAVGCARFGIEADLFHPWVAEARLFCATTFLLHRPDPANLVAALQAWAMFRTDRPDARLIVVGTGVLGAIRHAPATLRRWGRAVIADYPDDGLQLRETSALPSDEELATLFRGVDAVVLPRSESPADLAAALACGAVVVCPAIGAAAELGFAGTTALNGGEAAGGAWALDVEGLAAQFREIHGLDQASRRALARTALPSIRARLTWRSTCSALSEALAAWQEPRPIGARLRATREIEDRERVSDTNGMIGDVREPDPTGSVVAAPVRHRAAMQLAPPPPVEAFSPPSSRLIQRARRLRDVGRRVARALPFGAASRLRRLVGRLGRKLMRRSR